MMSRCPSVVRRPTLAPLCSSNALVATVVPWTIHSLRASISARSMPRATANRSSPSITPSDWSSGVEGTLAIVTRPCASTDTRSVKVPPTSMPMRNTMLAPLARDEAERAILIAFFRRALLGLAPTAATAGMGIDHVAGPQHDAGFLGLDLAAGLAGRLQPISMRHAVLAAEQAAGAVFDPVARGVADGGRRRLDNQLQFAARSATVAAIATAVG